MFPSWEKKSVMFYVNVIISHTDKKSRCLLVDLTWIIQLQELVFPSQLLYRKTWACRAATESLHKPLTRNFSGWCHLIILQKTANRSLSSLALVTT